ncbi:MAG: menaquinone biosynthetic enzyme MqnA/MqnD family protein [Pyrinomonadaceae bacterium]
MSHATINDFSRPPRIAASSYLNTAPLIWSFQQGTRQRDVQLITDTAPSRCAEMLLRGEVAAALVPVVEYQRAFDLLIVPDVCVGARSNVRSVVLVTRGIELKEVRSIALDTSSRTSAALVQVIFREFLNVKPKLVPRPPDLRGMLKECDAALIIGDPAMIFSREEFFVYDLAGLWRARTGLGFVFAMWMTRAGYAAEAVRTIDFAGARDEGLQRVDEIVSLYARTLSLPPGELNSYLLENISFVLNAEMRAGLDLFYRLALKHEIIPGARPLRLIDL